MRRHRQRSAPNKPAIWPKGAISSLVAAMLLPVMALYCFVLLTPFLLVANFYKLLDLLVAKQRLSEPDRTAPTKVVNISGLGLGCLVLCWLCLPCLMAAVTLGLLLNAMYQTLRWVARWATRMDRRLTRSKSPTWLLPCALGATMALTGWLLPPTNNMLVGHLPAGHHLAPSTQQAVVWGLASLLVLASCLQCSKRRLWLPKRFRRGLHVNVGSAMVITLATACTTPTLLDVSLLHSVPSWGHTLAAVGITWCCALCLAAAYHLLLQTQRQLPPLPTAVPIAIHRVVELNATYPRDLHRYPTYQRIDQAWSRLSASLNP